MQRWQSLLELLLHHAPILSHCVGPFVWDDWEGCLWGCAAFPFSDLGKQRIGWSSAMPPNSLGLPYSSSDVSSFLAWALGLIWNGLGFAKSFSPTIIIKIKKKKKKMGRGEKKYKFLETCIKLCLHFIVLF